MAIGERTLAAIRFGYGLRAGETPPDGAQAVMDALGTTDAGALPPVPDIPEILAQINEVREANRAMREDEGEAEEMRMESRMGLRGLRDPMLARRILAPLTSPDGLGERLVTFWADHFTVEARGAGLSMLSPHMVETAIRPNIAGSFGDLLIAAETHPAMLIYLNQNVSIGPNSRVARRQQDRGLNENLAREILELHTLGVGAAYSQTDVTEFAELLTGLTANLKQGARFLPRMAEPGTETVLGRVYGGDPARREHIEQALRDLAAHPVTAQHIARKLAVHFVSDAPDPKLIWHVATRWTETGGDLPSVYAALLEHPAAWAPGLAKARQPYDFTVATMRAFGMGGARTPVPERVLRQAIRHMRRMGQPLLDPAGPDGWPEAAGEWITPQGLAGRMEAARVFARMHADSVDPRDFVETALGEAATEDLRFAAAAAEQRWEGLVLTLLSPEFNRR